MLLLTKYYKVDEMRFKQYSEWVDKLLLSGTYSVRSGVRQTELYLTEQLLSKASSFDVEIAIGNLKRYKSEIHILTISV
jgi:hypothetical protein